MEEKKILRSAEFSGITEDNKRDGCSWEQDVCACMHVYACACEYSEIFVGMHAWLFAITEMST